MTSISQNVYIDKIADIVNENINTYHSTIKMKAIDVNSSNERDPTLRVSDHVGISKYKNIFAKGYVPNRYEEVFVIKKVKNIVPWTYVISGLNCEETAEPFYEKELLKANQKILGERK